MLNRQIVALASALLACLVRQAQAGLECPDSSYVVVAFTRTYTGNWMSGQPYDRVTISPNGNGETLAAAGITIDVYLKNCDGVPLPGVPAHAIWIFGGGLAICPGGTDSDAATDDQGHTRFTGTLKAGGCVETLEVVAQSIPLGTLRAGPTTVKTNSFDAAGVTSPRNVDSSDLALLASRLGVAANYTICMDFNESGPPTLDSSDLAAFAHQLGSTCQ